MTVARQDLIPMLPKESSAEDVTSGAGEPMDSPMHTETHRRQARPFRQHDVTRALRAATAAGLNVASVEIDPATGRITIRTGAEQGGSGDLDRWLSKNAH
jgi:hypothetical protein